MLKKFEKQRMFPGSKKQVKTSSLTTFSPSPSTSSIWNSRVTIVITLSFQQDPLPAGRVAAALTMCVVSWMALLVLGRQLGLW
jgi:hypothetical protein